MSESEAPAVTRRSRAPVVAAGILLSRIAGFLRERVVAHYFGVGAHADVFAAAFRAPNALQVMLGEQSLSAAFIPIYSRMLEEGRPREAGRFAGAIFGLLLAAAATLSLIGVLLARPLVAIFTPGFALEAAQAGAGGFNRFELTVTAVRLIFPMTGILVLSAWALGILNSHRRFFLPYAAPVLWNAAIMVALGAAGGVFFGTALAPAWLPAGKDGILIAGCLGALAGGVLQFGVQLPLVARELQGFRLSVSTRVAGVSQALRAFGPAVAGRGVVQLSLYLDTALASLLAVGAVGALRWASTLYALPISLFAMSVAAAELPELSRRVGRTPLAPAGEAAGALAQRTAKSLSQIAFLVVPTMVGYLAFGFLVAGALYRTGDFGLLDNWLVYLVLAGYTCGLPASAASRLLQNVFFALRDTRTPAQVAAARVTLSAVMGFALMRWLDGYRVLEALPVPFRDSLEMSTAAAGEPARALYLGALGLALGSAAGAWVELALLRRSLAHKLGSFALPVVSTLRLLVAALVAAVPAAVLWRTLGSSAGTPESSWRLIVTAAAVLGAYGLAYLVLAALLKAPELEPWKNRLLRR